MKGQVAQSLRVMMLGSFPPQAQGISPYCGALAQGLGHRCTVHAAGFRRMYPKRLFPGVKAAMDTSSALPGAPGLRVTHDLTWYNPFGWVKAALAAPVDLFHLQWWSLPLFPIALTMTLLMRLRGIPVVVTVHNVLPHESSRLFITAGKVICALAAQVIVHSRQNQEQLIAHYGVDAARCALVPLSVYAAPTPLPPAEAKERLGLPPEAPVLLFFGIIRPYKGLLDLLKSFGAIAERHPQARLMVAGKAWESWDPYAACMEEAGIEDRVHLFLDYIPQEDVPYFFSAADLVVLPYTHFDAQSAVGAQALPYRKPILVSEVGSLPDWVDGDPHWIVPPQDAESLAARLDAFLSALPEEQEAFGELADRVLEKTRPEAVAEAHLAVYERACGSTGKGKGA